MNFISGQFRGYTLQDLRKDLIAGLIVGVIAIPLGMAFAIASGVKPEYGIYTTIIAGIFISLFGGSKFQIGGPTGAFIPILLAIVMEYGYENLLVAGFLAGVLLVLMGLFKLGNLIKFIPRPVTIGFTTGIAVIIFSGQISNFLGLSGIIKHEAFLLNMKEIGLHINTLNGFSLVTASLSLSVILISPRIFPKVPAPLIGLLLSTLVAFYFYPNQVATIGSTFGSISNQIPNFHFPAFSFDNILKMLRPAFVIAMLGGIESLLSAVVADGMAGSKHDSNRELIGQGLANMVTPFFGGIPATGAIARTATNIKSGAVSPLSGIIHGLVVLLILLLFAPYAAHIPLASMAPILMVVAWNMSERKEFLHVLKTKTGDSAILMITFLLTVFTDLTTAVEVGLVLAVILFVIRMSEILTVVKALPNKSDKSNRMVPLEDSIHTCPQISIYTIEGPLFFGAAQHFTKTIMDSIKYHPKVLILRMGNVPYMDITGESNLEGIINHYTKRKGLVLITEIKEQPLALLKKAGLYDKIKKDHFFEHTGDAINYAFSNIEEEQCLRCHEAPFKECNKFSNSSIRYDTLSKEPVLMKS